MMDNAFKQLDIGNLTAEEAKLQELEAAASTVARIKALSGIPEELKELEKKLAGINEAKIKQQASTLVNSAKTISAAMNNAVTESGLDSGDGRHTINALVMTQMEQVGLVRELIGKVVDNPIPGEAKQTERINLLKHGITQTLGMTLGIGTDASSLTKMQIANKILGDLSTSMGFATAIFESIPSQIDAQVRRADKVISGVRRMVTQLSDSTVTGKKIKGVVDLAKAINEGGSLTVNHREAGFEARFTVFIDSKQLATELVSVRLDGNKTIQTGTSPSTT